MRTDLPQFKAGDTLRVHFKVIEGNRQRIQVFEGICIKRQGSGFRETFTVRKQSFGVGVECTFPLHSPKIESSRSSPSVTCAARSSTTCAREWARGARSGAPAELACSLGRVARSSGQRLLGFDRKLGVRYVAGADEAGRGLSPVRSSWQGCCSITRRFVERASGRSPLSTTRNRSPCGSANCSSKRLARVRRRSASGSCPWVRSTGTDCTDRTSPG